MYRPSRICRLTSRQAHEKAPCLVPVFMGIENSVAVSHPAIPAIYPPEARWGACFFTHSEPSAAPVGNAQLDWDLGIHYACSANRERVGLPFPCDSRGCESNPFFTAPQVRPVPQQLLRCASLQPASDRAVSSVSLRPSSVGLVQGTSNGPRRPRG